ncbi:hypothetical protein BGZ75_000749, partial [Mortierella antarctica]
TAAAASSAASSEAASPTPSATEVATTQVTTTEADDSVEAAAAGAVPSSASEHRSPEPEISEDEASSSKEIDDADDAALGSLQGSRLKRRAKMVNVIHARFSDIVRQIKQIHLERFLRKDMDSLKLFILQGYNEKTDRAPGRSTQAYESQSAKFSFKWDKNYPEHCALHRVFGEELLKGQEVDFKDSTILDLNVSSLQVEDMVQGVAIRIVKFRDDFERWCRWYLSDDLMDKLAWDYMPSALSKVGLAKDYQELIKELPIEKRTWKQVVVCLNKALKTELLEAHLADEVLTARPKVGETFLAFTQCLIPWSSPLNSPDDGCSVLIKALGNHLSDVSFQATIEEYGSFDEVRSIKNPIPSTAAPMEASTNTESNTLDPENIQLNNQESSEPQPQTDEENTSPHAIINGAESTQSNYTGEESMARDVDSDNSPADDDGDPFELFHVEVPDEDISEARTTLKGLIDVQELQLRKLLAIKRHIQQKSRSTKPDCRI